MAGRPRNVHHTKADLPALRVLLDKAIAARDHLQQGNRNSAAEEHLVEAQKTCCYYRELIDSIERPHRADVAVSHS